MKIKYCFYIIIAVFIGCSKEEVIENKVINIPKGFPEIEYPDSNQYSYSRWKLGKKLFYDPIMSKNNNISCASCHLPSYGFSDTMALSLGDNGSRAKTNSPTLTNVVYQPYFTRAGGVRTLEMQVLIPIQEHDELNNNIVDIAEKLNKDEEYVKMSKETYNRAPDAFTITSALATFERSLISGNSSYDKFLYEGGNLSNEELKGKELFFSSKTNCSHCHSGFNFSNYSFENNGLDIVYTDSGRMRVTKNEADRDKFKVPTLRNIELTAPYMHNGSFRTLSDVIDHYNSGGTNHPSKNPIIKPLNLTKEEKSQLEAFLKSLTDQTFINNKNLRP